MLKKYTTGKLYFLLSEQTASCTISSDVCTQLTLLTAACLSFRLDTITAHDARSGTESSLTSERIPLGFVQHSEGSMQCITILYLVMTQRSSPEASAGQRLSKTLKKREENLPSA
ncbi:hypothetical protein JRQ81_012258 [Phrynocephalus forsythii]|uniref:Uncharacterized protein n=1 Tax=Phrynocephalus forsythii TaxID=171643 RepID=A0A9Q1APW0_9SAUR|nr:hypothetical protein JRQ81_012258 [Phrynocephalus forsythii]